MVTPPNQTALGLDRAKLRLAVLGVLLVAAFTALFSRLWYLQVLASQEYSELAEETKVRLVYSEPPRGRILDRNGKVLVDNRRSLSVTIDRLVLDDKRKRRRVLRRLAMVLDVDIESLKTELKESGASPYKPVPVRHDISERIAGYILEHAQDFPGVGIENLWLREYPHGNLAAHVLGYVREIDTDQLKEPYFKRADPGYRAGDIVGQTGVERAYDRWLRGTPAIERVIVNSTGDVIGEPQLIQEEDEGHDLVLSIDAKIQRATEKALDAGLEAARASNYKAPAGAVVVMDPRDGAVVAMASSPTYDPSTIADGISEKEWDALGHSTPGNPDDDAFNNRAIQAQRPPGSTFKVVTAGAALASNIATKDTHLPCPGSKIYPPQGGPGAQVFRNWTSADNGILNFVQSLEQSCDTFYYELGWRMEAHFGAALGNGSERFQAYARKAGLGHTTGVDLPYEAPGRIPDEEWCEAAFEATKDSKYPTCEFGWLPGFTVNMSIGQGDVITTPLQMAVTTGAIGNGGEVMRPRLGWRLQTPVGAAEPNVVKEYKAKRARRLGLETSEISLIQQGLIDVISGGRGTAQYAFSGFPTNRFPLAGKTGTAQLRSGDTPLNDAWFVSYGPAYSPEYVISVYVEKAGHGGETAAPIARQIWESIFDVDETTKDVQVGRDFSG